MRDPLRKQVRLCCSLEHAFEVFTARIDLWWPSGHRRFADSNLVLEASVGGRFFERSATGEEAVLGEVLLADPPHHLRYTWHPGAVDRPTEVDVHFRRDGDEVVVEVEHSEAAAELGDLWPERAALFTRGWDHVLAGLASFVVGPSVLP